MPTALLPPSVVASGDAVQNLHDSLVDTGIQEWATYSEALSPTQKILAQTIVPEADPAMRRVFSKGPEPSLARAARSEDEIAEDLNLPVNSVRRLATELDEKLKNR